MMKDLERVSWYSTSILGISFIYVQDVSKHSKHIGYLSCHVAKVSTARKKMLKSPVGKQSSTKRTLTFEEGDDEDFTVLLDWTTNMFASCLMLSHFHPHHPPIHRQLTQRLPSEKAVHPWLINLVWHLASMGWGVCACDLIQSLKILYFNVSWLFPGERSFANGKEASSSRSSLKYKIS